MLKSCFFILLRLYYIQCTTDTEWSEISDPRIYVKPNKDAPSETRIIGGTEVEPNSIPYQVALIIDFPGGRSFCGGSLISKNYVLTAAHCANNAKSVEVVMGAHDLRKNETTQHRATCQDITVHPEWNGQTLRNDIALIKLPQSVDLTKYVGTVNLAKSGTFAETTALLTGWGKTSDTARVSNVLHQVNLAVLDNSECGNFYEEIIQPTHICTSGAEIKGGCNGDSGGPLVVDDNQIGIVSFGSNKCTKGYPTVFTRVTEYIDWIKEHTDLDIK